jgi:hypothetical protein
MAPAIQIGRIASTLTALTDEDVAPIRGAGADLDVIGEQDGELDMQQQQAARRVGGNNDIASRRGSALAAVIIADPEVGGSPGVGVGGTPAHRVSRPGSTMSLAARPVGPASPRVSRPGTATGVKVEVGGASSSLQYQPRGSGSGGISPATSRRNIAMASPPVSQRRIEIDGPGSKHSGGSDGSEDGILNGGPSSAWSSFTLTQHPTQTAHSSEAQAASGGAPVGRDQVSAIPSQVSVSGWPDPGRGWMIADFWYDGSLISWSNDNL